MECKVTKIIKNEICPIICSFKSPDSFDSTCEINAQLFQNVDKRIIVLDNKKVLHVGQVLKSEEQFNTILMVKRKDRNKLRLVPLNKALLSVDNLKRDNNRSPPQDRGQLNETLFTASDVYKRFGSKKAKRNTEQHERLKSNMDNATETLDNAVTMVEIDTTRINTSKLDENEVDYRPPIDREASSKEEVYPLGTLVPSSILNSLENYATDTLDSNLENVEVRPFIKQWLIRTKKSTGLEEEAKLLRCKVLLYVDLLIKLLLTNTKQMGKTFTICDYSSEANQYILENFTVAGPRGRNRPLSMRDKCICYILVLLVITLDYSIELTDLATELKFNLKKLQEIARILGFSLTGNVITLKLPLPAPLTVLGKRKRK